MLKENLDKKKDLQREVETELLLQSYSKFVSRSHTIFSTLFNVISSILFGTLGIIISLIDIKLIPWNKYYFFLALIIDLIIIGLVILISIYKIYECRKIRTKIVCTIKELYF